jgi:hypothetical protein
MEAYQLEYVDANKFKVDTNMTTILDGMYSVTNN